MLTNERQQVILNLLAEKQTIKIQDVVEVTNASESTIRRDLTELENEHKLERIHGGATISGRKLHEPSIRDKSSKNLQEKMKIAKYAASFIQEGDCIFLDAGTTTLQMIPFLQSKNVVVVTNGLTHVEALIEHGVTTYLTGGYVKGKTGALVGTGSIQSLQNYRFDKCFLGVNGFDIAFGYTTPDPEEAAVKHQASVLAKNTYAVADHTKYEQVSFSKINELHQATLITGAISDEAIQLLTKKYDSEGGNDMIYTCTITPSLDYTTYLPAFKTGELNRSNDVRYYPGGKGINVSRVLKRLDVESVAIGYVGGFVGDYIKTFLHDEAIQTDFIETTEITRINVKIKAEEESELNGPGPTITKVHQQVLLDKVQVMKKGDWFVLAGSLPASMPISFFEQLAAICDQNDVRFVLDTSGPALKKLIHTKPFLMKPNAEELGELFDTQITTKQEAFHYAKELIALGAGHVVVSMGGEGALLVTKELALAAEAPKGQVVNTVGAGDSLVAGFLASYVHHENATEAFRYGVASGSATAFQSDLCLKVDVEALVEEVKIVHEVDVRK